MLNSVHNIPSRECGKLPALAHKQTSRGHLGQACFALDVLQNYFARRSAQDLIQDQASMRNVPPIRFYCFGSFADGQYRLKLAVFKPH
jgi:hypothetical protein